MQKSKKQLSFTLIELLVVIAIVGVLAGLIMLTMSDATEQARIAKLKVYGNSIRDVLGNNLVSEWKFESGSHTDGQSADTTDLKDTWDTNNAATVSGPLVKESTNCVTNKCLYFDGVDDYVSIPNRNSLNVVSALTIGCWVKPSTIIGTKDLLCKGYQTSNAGYEFRLYGNEMEFRINPTNLSYAYRRSTGANIEINKWQYLVVIFNGTSIDFYKDGLLISSVIANGQLYVSDSELRIGSYRSATLFFGGYIDDIRFYNSFISTAQIRENYLAGLDELLANGGITKQEYDQRIADLNLTYAEK